jgi:hypothetical protein|tara:strand:+ start:667 stop:1041 length:375 start_codon:yes stop_codon:yes gene_type:complete
MKNFLIFILFIILSFSSSNAKVNKSDKEKLIKCLGLYAAHSFLTQDKLSLENIEHSLGGKKFLTMYLIENGMNEDEVNKKMIEITDEIYGQPFDEKGSKNCDLYVYNLIPGSKEKIDELGSNQY